MNTRLLCALMILSAAAPGVAATPLASVVQVAGPVDVRLAGSWQDANRGDKLGAGDAVRTGQRGYATLRDARGTVTELFPLASVEFPADTAMNTIAGRIWTHFKKIPGLTREIKTPSAVALIRGTTLAVEASEGQTRVTVLEGLVEVRDLAGKTALVPDGYTIRADRAGIGRVERALSADLDEGRKFLHRSREWLGPDSPQGSGVVFPGLSIPAPAAARRPTAIQRAEAEFEKVRAGASGGSPSHGSAAGSGGTGAQIKAGTGPEAEASAKAVVDGRKAPGLRVETGIRTEMGSQRATDRREAGRAQGSRAETGRAETGRAETGRSEVDRSDPPAHSEPGVRAEVGVRTEVPAHAEVGVGTEPLTRSDPPAATRADEPKTAHPLTAGPSDERKDPTLEIDIRSRTDILGR